MVPVTVMSDTGCIRCQTFREQISAKARLAWVGHSLSWLTQNKREELQDNTAKVTHNAV